MWRLTYFPGTGLPEVDCHSRSAIGGLLHQWIAGHLPVNLIPAHSLVESHLAVRMPDDFPRSPIAEWTAGLSRPLSDFALLPWHDSTPALLRLHPAERSRTVGCR